MLLAQNLQVFNRLLMSKGQPPRTISSWVKATFNYSLRLIFLTPFNTYANHVGTASMYDHPNTDCNE